MINDFLHNPVDLAQHFIKSLMPEPSVAIDATAGNGGDTIFLASLAGPEGQVYAFDIQEKALAKTAEKVAESSLDKVVHLIHSGHEQLASYIKEPVDIIMFNLGYLPGGDHNLITGPETTLAGVRQGLQLLKPGGIMSVVIYPGHQGGKEEALAVNQELASLPKDGFEVLTVNYLNRLDSAPYLILVQKNPQRGRIR